MTPEQKITNTIPVVIYARYSSDKQTENSIDGQLRCCRQYAEQYGYTIIGEYIDRAKSGTSDNRPQFQQMIADSKKQSFKFVIVYRFDRFARNRVDSVIYKKELEKNGARVLSTTEHIGDGEEGAIIEAIYEAMDEAYSKRLSKITKRGMREAAMKGLCTGGNIPFGYKVENRKLVIDDASAPTVKYIFAEYASGKTKKQIADALNEKGYRRKSGKPFTINSFSYILSNRIYMGDYSLGDIKRSCPAIIDQVTFDKVQTRVAAGKKTMGRKVSAVNFSLSGKLFCGHCGAAMTGDSGTSRDGTRHYYYTCHKRKKHKTCDKKREKAEFLEYYICEQTVQFVLTPHNIQFIAEKVVEKHNAEKNTGFLRELEKRLEAIDIEIRKNVDALINTTAASAMKIINDNIEKLDLQKADTEKEIAKQQLIHKTTITIEEVSNWLKSFCHGDLTDADFRRRIIDVLVNVVYLYDDKIVIYYNATDCTQVSYIDVLQETEDALGNYMCSDSYNFGEPCAADHYGPRRFFFWRVLLLRTVLLFFVKGMFTLDKTQ